MILLQNIFHQFLPQILATLIKKYNSLKTLEDALVEQTRSAAESAADRVCCGSGAQTVNHSQTWDENYLAVQSNQATNKLACIQLRKASR